MRQVAEERFDGDEPQVERDAQNKGALVDRRVMMMVGVGHGGLVTKDEGQRTNGSMIGLRLPIQPIGKRGRIAG
jgi:hypothetical protein